MPRTVVLGGGLTGLSYAYGEAKKGNDVLVLEKEHEVGGILKPIEFNKKEGKYSFDFGPHVFRSSDENISSFIQGDIFGGNCHGIQLNPIIRKRRQYFDSVIPVITFRNIEKLLNEGIQWCGISGPAKWEPSKNFEDCIVSQVGETLFEEFYGDYSQKFWGVGSSWLSDDLAPKNLRLGYKPEYAHITTGFKKKEGDIYSSWSSMSVIPKWLSARFREMGGSLITGWDLAEITGKKHEIKSLWSKDEVIDVEHDSIISTIPITILCKLLNIKTKLRYRADICIYIGMKDDGSEPLNSVTYFHDPELTVCRLHEPKFRNPGLAPAGYRSICAEVTCFEHDFFWGACDKVSRIVLRELIEGGIIDKADYPRILGVVRYPHAYPLYEVGYKEELNRVFGELSEYKNLQVIGRTGSFRYENMEEGIKWAFR